MWIDLNMASFLKGRANKYTIFACDNCSLRTKCYWYSENRLQYDESMNKEVFWKAVALVLRDEGIFMDKDDKSSVERKHFRWRESYIVKETKAENWSLLGKWEVICFGWKLCML